MQAGLVSVVLPIYNVEKYLDRCVTSVVNQTYRDLEIILVDDGSPDNCPQLCEEWAARDPRIKVVHKQNAGLGMARNTGIENATGQYICFFDSDDYIAPDTIEKCMRKLQETQSQIALFGFHNVNSAGQIIHSHIPAPHKLVYEGDAVRSELLPDLMHDDPNADAPTNLWMSMWSALFSTELIHRTGWRVVSERQIISEDVYSLLSLYAHVDKVVILPDALYYYCENGTSLTKTYRSDRFARNRHFYVESLKLINALGYQQVVTERLAMVFLSYTVATLKQEAAAPRSVQENLAGIKAIICDDVLQNALRIGKNPHDSTAKKLLLLAVRYRMHRLCYVLLKAKG